MEEPAATRLELEKLDLGFAGGEQLELDGVGLRQDVRRHAKG